MEQGAWSLELKIAACEFRITDFAKSKRARNNSIADFGLRISHRYFSPPPTSDLNEEHGALTGKWKTDEESRK
jgi:hypothetical protein